MWHLLCFVFKCEKFTWKVLHFWKLKIRKLKSDSCWSSLNSAEETAASFGWIGELIKVAGFAIHWNVHSFLLTQSFNVISSVFMALKFFTISRSIDNFDLHNLQFSTRPTGKLQFTLNFFRAFFDNRNFFWIFQHELKLRCWVNETRLATVVSAIECGWRVERCRLMLREKWKMLREWNANRTVMKLKMNRKTLWSFPLNSWTFFSCDHEFARLTDYIDWKLN